MLNVDLHSKRALVTGANSGIGEAIANCLAEAGADVAINFVSRAEAAETVAAAVRAKGAAVVVKPWAAATTILAAIVSSTRDAVEAAFAMIAVGQIADAARTLA